VVLSRSRREFLNGAVFGLQSSAGLESKAHSPGRHVLTPPNACSPNLLSLDTDPDLVTGDMNREVLLAVHIAANATKVSQPLGNLIEPSGRGTDASLCHLLYTPVAFAGDLQLGR